MSSALTRQQTFQRSGVITATTIDWTARREAVEAAIAAAPKQRSTRISGTTEPDDNQKQRLSARISGTSFRRVNPFSSRKNAKASCIICTTPLTQHSKPTPNNNLLELGLCISTTAYRQLEMFMTESDSDTATSNAESSKQRGKNSDLNANDVWTLYIAEDRRYPVDEYFFRRRGFDVKIHAVANPALLGIPAIQISRTSGVGQRTKIIQRQRDIWPCISQDSSKTESDWNLLRKSCLAGKKVRCLLLDSEKSFSMEAVMTALRKVEKDNSVNRRTSRLLNGESEMERMADVRLCTVGVSQDQTQDREEDSKKQEGQGEAPSRFDWRKMLEGEYKVLEEIKLRRMAEAVAGRTRVAS